MCDHEALIMAPQHQELLHLWRQLQTDGLKPSKFPPQVGVMPVKKELPRILLIGKAPGEIESSEDFLNATACSCRHVKYQMTNPGRFWLFGRELADKIYSETQIDDISEFPQKIIGWTNLIKIGRFQSTSAPSGRLFNQQVGLSIKILIHEFQNSKADAIIFLTGNSDYPRCIQFPALEQETEAAWQFYDCDEAVAYQNHRKYGLLFWTDHPQKGALAGPAGREKVLSQIVPQIIEQWRKRVPV